jgi:pimeloyl-ACP methyl ester carboxylesterase
MPYANNNGIKIYYEVEGEGQSLMMLHGFASSLEHWREAGYVDALKSNYQLVLVDLIGHGKSDKPHDPESYTLQEFSGDLIAVLDDLKVKSTHIIGVSGGGFHCLVLGSHAIERIKSITLIGSGPHKTGVDRMKLLIEQGPESYAAMMEQSGPLPAGLIQRLLANDFEALLAILNSPSIQANLSNDLLNMHIPFLVLIGANDLAYPPQKEKEIFRIVPDLTFVTLPRLDHFTSMNRSGITIPYIKQFLAKFSDS